MKAINACRAKTGAAGLYALSDERGTLIAYADSAGEVQHKNSYNAFGQQKSWNEGNLSLYGPDLAAGT